MHISMKNITMMCPATAIQMKVYTIIHCRSYIYIRQPRMTDLQSKRTEREEGNVIAVIGDGSLSGGEALEGLDYAAELGGNLIIVVNDNDMSIAENHGGLYDNLKERS